MNIFSKIKLKAQIEIRFLLEQKWGIREPKDPYSIPKFVLKKYLPKNPVIVDCGAHIGSDSIELSKIFPKAKIYSIEPIPVIFERLKHNTRRRNNIQCFNIALSNKNGQAEFFVSSGSSDASSSLLRPSEHKIDHPTVMFNDSIIVTTQTLNDWGSRNNVSGIDFLWLDMQGFEYQMLSSSTEALSKVKVIHTEVSLKEVYEGAIVYSEFKLWLESQGFKLVKEAIPAGSDMGNALFVKNDG